MIGTIYQPPYPMNLLDNIKSTKVFLAGSIEQDTTERWQDRVANELIVLGYDVLNPRRDDWHKCKEDITDPYFYQQVNWELNAIDRCDFVLMYFDINTKSPISLLELGYIIGRYRCIPGKLEKLIVVCPEGFWKKGNVDIICERNKILQYSSLYEFVCDIKEEMERVKNANIKP